MTRWPRYCEAALAVWLAASGWVVEYGETSGHRLVTIAAGLTILALDALSITSRGRYAYLLILPVAAGLIALGFQAPRADSQAAQNAITVGALLLLFAVLPTEATLPPASWRSRRGVGAPGAPRRPHEG
jgi:hypothetical protein